MVAVASMSATEKEPEFARYAPTKLDAAVMPKAKAAAALKEQTVQEWLSDIANEASAKQLGIKPIKRLPPKPRKPKSSD